MTKRQLRNRITQKRVNIKRNWYLHQRPLAQKLFFPIVFALFAIACINYERHERGMIDITNAAVVLPQEKEQESIADSPEAPIIERIVVSNTIEEHIRAVFHEEPEVALAVAKSESGLNPDAKGWNCRYGNRSTSCKVEDREKAWSVDCSIFQINVIGHECPEHLMDVTENIKIAKQMYNSRGFQPWVGFWNKQYLNHM